MYRSIVVPLDRSDLSERAVPFGRTLASAGRAHLILMHVISPVDFLDAREPAGRDKALDDANAYLAGLVVPSEGDSKVEALAYSGEAASLIVDEIRARPWSLTVMSTHGRSGVSEVVYGSVTAEVIRRSQQPVLVIPPRCHRPWSARQGGRVLVALDGSKLAEAILPEALDVAQALRVPMTLVDAVAATTFIRVEGCPDPVGVPNKGISAGEAEAYLNDVATELRWEHQQVSVDTPEGLDPASAILFAAEEQDTALIAMATHGRGGLAEVVLGSVARAVVKRAVAPVLLLRPAALR